MTDQSLVEELLARSLFPRAGTPVRCGVSGGADSLALLILACRSGCSVTAVHVDHGLRPGSADEALIVEQAADRFGAAFRAKRVVVEVGSNLEARCRAARRRALGSGALTGHTADDQAETLLINLLRGAGVTGIGAMEQGGTHPILGLRRHETHRLCEVMGLQPVHDSSNDDPRFVRNRLRHELLPLMASISNRDPVPLLNRTADQARATDSAMKALSSDLDPTNTSGLRKQPAALAAVALRFWLTDEAGHPPSAAELERVFDVVWGRATACELSGGRRVARTAGVLRIDGCAAESAGYDQQG